MSDERDEVDEFFDQYPEPIAQLCRSVRSFIQAQVGTHEETLHRGWKSVSYKVNEKSACATQAHAKWVNIQFPSGVDLPDPHGLLEGTGKRMRHVKIKSDADLSEKVAELIRAAAV